MMKRTTTVGVNVCIYLIGFDIFLCRSVKFRDRIDTGEIDKR